MSGRLAERKGTVTSGKHIIVMIAIINLAIRLVIYFSTELFYFTDYGSYLSAVDTLASGVKIPLLVGNFVMTLSYLGYFAVNITGSIDSFFIFNAMLGTSASLLISLLTIRLSGSVRAGIIAMIMLTLYTEFMVFSSIFYTPVIMIFLLTIFIWTLYYFYTLSGRRGYYAVIPATAIYLAGLLFKPELVFLPLFIIMLTIAVRRQRQFAYRNILLTVALVTAMAAVYGGGLSPGKSEQPVSNSFVFYGHTDYGGDGGEGSFVYEENRERYWNAFHEYCVENSIPEPGIKDYNDFQKREVINFITDHPGKWIMLQFRKFSRTFGVVPEGSSFKVLYTGLLNENLWLTSLVVVAPVATIILMFILFFRIDTLRNLINGPWGTEREIKPGNPGRRYFIWFLLMLFGYYIIASVFFGHYQERYRMPLMVCFIIPLTALFVSSFIGGNTLSRKGLYVKGLIILFVMMIWVVQAVDAVGQKERLNRAIESVNNHLKDFG